jgi:hypothetical protein
MRAYEAKAMLLLLLRLSSVKKSLKVIGGKLFGETFPSYSPAA